MNFNKAIKSLNNFFENHWKKWTIFAILAIVFYAGFICFKYIYNPIYKQKEITPFKLEIKKSAYQSIMDNYDKKQEIIDKINNKIYKDPFN